ncbi:MAG: UbiD family decarboxylase [Deltaproteobacteria bacterium]|nr:UbiD family decarboxylase [Deltaproteobacteria bacterium]
MRAGLTAMFPDLRTFIDRAKADGELVELEGVDWDLEIGVLTEWQAGRPDGPVLLFDRVKGYPAGYRIATNLYTTHRRAALALGLPTEASRLEQLRLWRERERSLQLVPPREVARGPLLEHVITGDALDLLSLPVPRWHEHDGGRYLGTGCMIVTRDPEDGWVNLGTERVQLQDGRTLNIYLSPGRHTDMIRQKYWQRGEPCPAAVICGQEPLLWAASNFPVPWGVSEYAYAGGLRGAPVEVVPGPTTGLPLPATAELAVEGLMLPPGVEPDRPEGPFGEWTGYYHPSKPQPPVRVTSLLHRSQPVLQGTPPLLTPLDYALKKYKNPNLILFVGRLCYFKGLEYLIEAMQYAGQAMQVALKVASSYSTAYMLRWIIVVDEDIDPTDWHQVSWALNTRCEPADSIHIVNQLWGSPIDPRLTPEKRAAGDYTHSTAIVLACKPYHWKGQFPRAIRTSPAVLESVRKKWQAHFEGR